MADLTPQRLERLRQVASQRQLDISVVCENITDPHNVSAIMRSCDAFGIQTLDVIGGSEEFTGHKKTSSSAKKWVTVRSHTDVKSCFDMLRQEGKNIYVTRLDPQAQSFWNVDWTQPCAVVLGNEHAGVSDEALQRADGSIYIPMKGMVQSLNVSVAAAIVLAEISRQRGKPAATLENEELFNEWLSREQTKSQ